MRKFYFLFFVLIIQINAQINSYPAGSEKMVVQISQEKLDEQDERNKPAQDIYDGNPEGSDEFPIEPYEVKLYFKVDDKLSPEENTDEFQEDTFKLNNQAFYYLVNQEGQQEGYRDVAGSIELIKLITKNDNVKSAQCCQNIKSIEKQSIEVQGKSSEVSCFKVDTKHEQWHFCSCDEDLLEKAREKLISQTIVRALYLMGVTKIKPFLASGGCKVPKNWKWMEQQNWPCTCISGTQQSPLYIMNKMAKPNEIMKILWDYKPSKGDSQLNWNQHESELIANFGNLIFVNPDDEKRFYRADKINFRFPAEHQLEDIINTCKAKQGVETGEVEIHHTDEFGNAAILSIIITDDGDTENEFFSELNLKEWKAKTSMCLDIHPDLSNIWKGEKHYFYYKGSYTTPPCKEQIDRFVMKKSVSLTFRQFNDLKDVIFEEEVEQEGNSRQVQIPDPQNTIWTIEYEDPCSTIIEEIEGEAEEEEELDEPPPKYKFVKTTTNITHYDLVFHKPLTGEMGNKINVEMVSEDQVPEDIKEKLIDSAMRNIEIVKEAHGGFNPFRSSDNKAEFRILKDRYNGIGIQEIIKKYTHKNQNNGEEEGEEEGEEKTKELADVDQVNMGQVTTAALESNSDLGENPEWLGIKEDQGEEENEEQLEAKKKYLRFLKAKSKGRKKNKKSNK